MNVLQIRPSEHIIAIDNWREFRRDGEQFLHTAISAANNRNRRFTPDTLYNLVAMAIEKLIMAFLMRRGDLADNHTMLDLLRALERHIAIGPDLAGKFAYLDAFQEICAIDTYSCRTPSPADVERITAIGAEVLAILEPHLAEADN
ncbi:MAG: hypothetical protein F9K32_14460 [Desulfobulbaceae bacterium]|nr:MAG: hypothetical protein F9K32_14460 [Desulfobulbaceae bacterium]